MSISYDLLLYAYFSCVCFSSDIFSCYFIHVSFIFSLCCKAELPQVIFTDSLSYSILAQALRTRTRSTALFRILTFIMMRILVPWILCFVASSQECQDEAVHMQIAETGRPFRRLFRRLHSRPRHYHYGTTTTCPLELGPEVNDTMCDLFQVPSYTEATPQHCAEQCQEVYGDTTGVIDFDPATTECRCCVGNGTRTSAEKSTYSWSKPCGGPFKPCGDRGVVISDFFIQENTTCTDNTGFQEFTDLTHCAEECTITLEDISVEVVSNSTHCACCKLGSPTEPATGFVINIADCAPVSPPASVPVDDER